MPLQVSSGPLWFGLRLLEQLLDSVGEAGPPPKIGELACRYVLSFSSPFQLAAAEIFGPESDDELVGKPGLIVFHLFSPIGWSLRVGYHTRRL